ncbi:hypothetical protein J6590_002945 [Homalodisca vitripennis]|nr:hypothetical protein J6590_002945 [Homalodisca vitripennis]
MITSTQSYYRTQTMTGLASRCAYTLSCDSGKLYHGSRNLAVIRFKGRCLSSPWNKHSSGIYVTPGGMLIQRMDTVHGGLIQAHLLSRYAVERQTN